jgi:hypothetical protein
MSTWIFERGRASGRLVAGLAAVSLAACGMGTGPEATAGRAGISFVRAAPHQLRVAQGSVVISGPDGFCIDRSASRDDDEGAFVLLASCAALEGSPGAPRAPAPVLLTASVAPRPGSGGRPEDRAALLSRYFSSDEGRAALARDGRAEHVAVDRMFARDGLFLIHARDRSAGLGPGLHDDYWRAIFEVNGRLVTASAVGIDKAPIGNDVVLSTLRQFADRIQDESARIGAGPELGAEEPGALQDL